MGVIRRDMTALQTRDRLTVPVVACFLLGLAIAFGPVSGARSASKPDARERVRQAIAAVGVILVRDPHGDSGRQLWPRGSAVLVRKDGVVATNLHVIEQDNSDAFFDELFFGLPGDSGGSWSSPNRYRLSVALTSGKYDLALLRIVPDEGQSRLRRDFPAIEIASSVKVQVLDDLTIIGYPETGGTTVTVNPGIVEGTDPDGGWIKTDGRLMHGNSGGAVVNNDGKLIGIPTKVVLDQDKGRAYGAVGFLRPAHLVSAMLAELSGPEPGPSREPGEPEPASPPEQQPSRAQVDTPATRQPREVKPALRLITVRGVVKSSTDSKPVAGVRVGLILAGSVDITETTLVTWGGSNGEGQFEMNRKVPAGRYTLRARAIGYEVFSRDVEINSDWPPLAITLEPSS